MNEEAWRQILGERVRASRRRKFRTVDKARQAAGVSRGTWDKVEQGASVKDFSLAAVEEALEWPPGYASAILEGRDPGPLEDHDVSLEQRVADLERLVARLSGITTPKGEDSARHARDA